MTQYEGFAGASARRESERLGRLRSSTIPAPFSASGDLANWRSGTTGEQIVGSALEDLVVDGIRAVHDRRVPGSLANIDHIAISPSGVYVVDSKNHVGRPRVDTLGGSGSAERRLYVERDDVTHFVHGVHRQVRVVIDALADPAVPVRGILCFVGASWELINGYLINGVGVTSLAGLRELLRTPGPLRPTDVNELHGRLSGALDPA